MARRPGGDVEHPVSHGKCDPGWALTHGAVGLGEAVWPDAGLGVWGGEKTVLVEKNAKNRKPS